MEKLIIAIASVLSLGSVAFAYSLFLSALSSKKNVADMDMQYLTGDGTGAKNNHIFIALIAFPLIILSCMVGFFQLKTRSLGLFWPATVLGAIGYIILFLAVYWYLTYGS